MLSKYFGIPFEAIKLVYKTKPLDDPMNKLDKDFIDLNNIEYKVD